MSGVFQTYLVWDSILKENSWELWATILLGLAMTATRVVAGLIRKDVTDSRAAALRNVGWAVLVMQSLTMARPSCVRDAMANPSRSIGSRLQLYRATAVVDDTRGLKARSLPCCLSMCATTFPDL